MGFWFKKDKVAPAPPPPPVVRAVQLPQHAIDKVFGEINVQQQGSTKTVTATVLMEPFVEGTQTGVAIDGSASMIENGAFGIASASTGRRTPIKLRCKGQVFEYGYDADSNTVEQTCQQVVPYLAEKLDADGGTSVIYWATGANGANVEELGDLTAVQARTTTFTGPKDWGTGTRLLPALRYFVERFASAKWGFYVFITDGKINDLEAVIDYTLELAHSVNAGQRNPVKCVLIGVGEAVDEDQMSALDDLPDTHGSPYDIWDHKIATTMRDLKDIFAEVVDQNTKVAPYGKVLDDQGNLVKQWSDGLPALLQFQLSAANQSFRLVLPGGQITQSLRES